jgi:phosphatidate cytidylyltransferase
MALNVETFKTRTLTAAVFVVIMLSGLLINHWTFLILFSIIHYGCWVEYQKLITLIDADYKNISPFHKYGVRLLGFGFMFWVTNDAFKIGEVSLYEIGWWLLIVLSIALPVMEIMVSNSFNFKNLGYSFLGLLYISISLGLLVNIRSGFDNSSTFFGEEFLLIAGEIVCILIIASLWINDTMAYIVGSLIGKTPFSSISPKKTWEGTLGGALLAIIVVTLTYYLINKEYISALFISAITVVFGTAGDLLESKLKRLAGVKDSGHIMPGHGGFLDRFDSLLFATPFVWLYVKLFV